MSLATLSIDDGCCGCHEPASLKTASTAYLIVTVVYDDDTEIEALRRKSIWPNSKKVFFVPCSRVDTFSFDCIDCELGGIVLRVEDGLVDWSRVQRIRVSVSDPDCCYEYNVHIDV